MMAIRTENYDVITTDDEYQNTEETKLERLWRYTKYFLKKFIAFLFSHVGLTCMVVVYAMLGGVLFRKIESPYEREVRKLVTSTKQEYLDRMMEYLDNSTTEDIFRKIQWLEHVDNILNEYKVKMHKVGSICRFNIYYSNFDKHECLFLFRIVTQNHVMDTCLYRFGYVARQSLKPLSHGQIFIRMQIMHIRGLSQNAV